jgi:hypothetical protein
MNAEDVSDDQRRIHDDIFGDDSDPDVIARLQQELAIAEGKREQAERRLAALQLALSEVSRRIDGRDAGHLTIKVMKLMEHNARMRHFLEQHEWEHRRGCAYVAGADTCNCDEDGYEGERLQALEDPEEPTCACKAGGTNFPAHDADCPYGGVNQDLPFTRA